MKNPLQRKQKEDVKRPQKKDAFQTNTTIKQKRARYIKSNFLFAGISCSIVYFAVNIYMSYSERFHAFTSERFFEWITSFPLSETIFAPPQGMAVLATTLFAAIVGIFAAKGYTRITDDITKEHGTAQWGEVKEFNSRYALPAPQPGHFTDLILSENARISTNIYHHQLALNTIIIGATRSGKSRFFLKPNICQMNCNYIITDPKGELLQATGSLLRSFGYRVRVFDINDKENCNTYNPLKYITCEEDVATLAQQLMDSTKLDEEGGSEEEKTHSGTCHHLPS